jgi:hypothetical protein
LRFAHRAAAAFFAFARRCSGDTPAQRAFAPFLPPSRPQARNSSMAIAAGLVLDFLPIRTRLYQAPGLKRQLDALDQGRAPATRSKRPQHGGN